MALVAGVIAVATVLVVPIVTASLHADLEVLRVHRRQIADRFVAQMLDSYELRTAAAYSEILRTPSVSQALVSSELDAAARILAAERQRDVKIALLDGSSRITEAQGTWVPATIGKIGIGSTIVHGEDGLWTLTKLPLSSTIERSRIVVIREPFDTAILSDWSRQCGATIEVEPGPGDRGDGLRLGLAIRLPLETGSSLLARSYRHYLWPGLIVLSIALAAGWLLARGPFRAIRRLTVQVNRIANGDHNARIASSRDDELGELARSVEGAMRQLVHRNAELQAINAKAELMVRAKSRFLATVSHELRTPMTAIIGMSEMALESGLPVETREQIETIKASADVLHSLLDEILDLSTVEAGRISFIPVDFDLTRMLSESVGMLRARAASHDLGLEVDITPDVPSSVHGEARRIRQVIVNLVGNAIKYTDEGMITVRVRRSRRRDTGPATRVRFSVMDTGVGIPPDRLKAIFVPFEQADASRSTEYEGSGLGLAISNKLVSILGGRLRVRSNPGRGSVFYFTIPLEPSRTALPPPVPGPGSAGDASADGAAAPAPASAPAGSSARFSVLVAEDTKANQNLARLMLEKLGHRVRIVANGREACQAFEEEVFDLVFMDVTMPIMNGFEATGRIRSAEKRSGEHTPIVAITAHAMPGFRERCLEAGMDDYISKPMRSKTMAETIARLCGPRSRIPELAGQVVARPAPPAAAPPPAMTPAKPALTPEDNAMTPIASALEYLDGDADAVRQIAEIFVRDAPHRLSDLRRAFDQTRPDRVEDLAHSLKGLFSTLAATHALELAGTLENRARQGTMEGCETLVNELEEETVRLHHAFEEFVSEPPPEAR